MTYITAAQVVEEKIIQIEYHLKRTRAMIESLDNTAFNSDSNESKNNSDIEGNSNTDESNTLLTKEEYIKQADQYQEQLNFLRSILDRFMKNLKKEYPDKEKAKLSRAKVPSRGDLNEA